MQLIPVIDLMGGNVVHAQRGQRQHYQPIQTPLAKDASPREVLRGLLNLHPFQAVYVADLNALMGRGNHRELLTRLQLEFPQLQFWIDQGMQTPITGTLPVFGTESLQSGDLAALKAKSLEFVLSLDFMDDKLMGDQAVLEQSASWPNKLILMTLNRVGSELGPDFTRIQAYHKGWPGRDIIAAGGVRNREDLSRLQDAGAEGVLLASALHCGALTVADLAGFA